ncbi:MAG TPA: hypothetical protein VF817_03935 [Patescibacteria group bacterium]
MSEHRFIPSIDAGPEEIKKQKEIINREGSEGSLAVQIGNESEQEKLYFERRNEGKYLNLESYIRANKIIIASAEEIGTEPFMKNLPAGTGVLLNGNFLTCEDINKGPKEYQGHTVIYVDGQKNLSLAYIKEQGIASLQSNNLSRRKEVVEELKSLNFILQDYDSIVKPFAHEVIKYVKSNKEAQEKEKRDSFDF